MVFPDTHLILNPDGSVYHLSLKPGHVADKIIVVGDPGRVHRVSSFFDEVVFEMNKREFITHTGYVGNERITVISSGMGADNVEILMTELDAIVNIDLKRRTPLQDQARKRLQIIRVGTSAAIQEDLDIGTHVVAQYALGMDVLMNFYSLERTPVEEGFEKALQEVLSLDYRPYCKEASGALLSNYASDDLILGNTVTCPGFYAPQGRQLTRSITFPDLVQQLMYFRYQDFWLTNLEMETAAYYAMGALLGHDVISLNAIIANRVTNEIAKDPNEVIDALIARAIQHI